MGSSISPIDAVVNEFVCYYQADELPQVLSDVTGHADDSAERLVEELGPSASQVAVMLRELADDQRHPLVYRIQGEIRYKWYRTDRDWAAFRVLVRRIADRIDAALNA
jgi:methionine salvage enolase-phosphatase E1